MEYIKHLSKDRIFRRVLAVQEPVTLTRKRNVFLSLCSSIMSQQLSTRVAAVINNRFLSLYPGKKPSPEDILNTDTETLRSIGLSNAKAAYVQHVARFALEQGLDNRTLNKLENEELIAYLTQIKGVGRWTVEMLMMFTLAREDVFAVGDLGIQIAMSELYGIDRGDKKKLQQEMLGLSERWSPYRTYACLHLWRWKDAKPIIN